MKRDDGWMKMIAMSVALFACGGGSGSDDDAASRDGGAGDALEADATLDSTIDAAMDASDAGVDSGIDRVDGPNDVEPPETELELGSDADHTYRYCWLLADIFCRGNLACCELPDRMFGDDVEDCHDILVENMCDIWLDRPDGAPPQNVDELEINLERLDEAAESCEDLTVKFVFAFGDLEIGADCSSEARNPSFLCGESAQCIGGVCTAFPEVGEACFAPPAANRCDGGEASCVDDVCVAHEDRPIGDACEEWGECATFRCEEGMCVEREESPWCFLR